MKKCGKIRSCIASGSLQNNPLGKCPSREMPNCGVVRSSRCFQGQIKDGALWELVPKCIDRAHLYVIDTLVRKAFPLLGIKAAIFRVIHRLRDLGWVFFGLDFIESLKFSSTRIGQTVKYLVKSKSTKPLEHRSQSR